MHTHKATRILCYWDSITRGRIPAEKWRFANDERRTWIVQKSLWDSFEIIEEWVRWRYTNYESNHARGRNWLPYFYPCILSHLPLDIIILFLWTNNTQIECNQSAEEITASFILYKEELQAACTEFEMHMPKVILVSPPYIDSSLLDKTWSFNMQSEIISKQFKTHYQKFAEDNQWWFFDAAEIIWYWVIDGIHLDKEKNQLLWEAIAKFIVTYK